MSSENLLYRLIMGHKTPAVEDSLEELKPISIDTWNAHVHPENGKSSGAMFQEVINGNRYLYKIDVRGMLKYNSARIT